MKRLIVGFAVLSIVLTLEAQSVHGAIITADVAVHSSSGQYTLLAPDVQNSDWFQYVWAEVPAFAVEQDVLFWQYEHTATPPRQIVILNSRFLAQGLY